MALNFFKKVFGQEDLSSRSRQVSRGEWERVIDSMVRQLSECREKWFALCVTLLKDKQNLRVSPNFAQRAEVATRIFQSIDALDGIAAKQYIQPADGRDFANKFFAAITEGQNVALVNQFHREFRNASSTNQGGEILLLSGYLTEAILTQADYEADMIISSTIPLLTNLNHSIVAASFGDDVTVAELQRKRDRA